ncbi:MAG: 50S ribosomal protein L1 [Phycisphaerae bacterium]|nr:50S ribosomal protein L1 [Phycisphaerae bacterium]
MAVMTQRHKAQLQHSPGDTPMPIEKAIEAVKQMASVKAEKKYKQARPRKAWDQTVEIALWLGIDPKQADQMIRGSVSLPKGIGATKRVIAFAEGAEAEAAKAAGAIEVGGEDLVKKIEGGWMDFDVAIAHPKLMGKVGKLGRVLGPQGKMPSPKSGTVTPDVGTAVKEYAAGKLEYRNDDGGNIHAVVGKVSFSTEDLKENIEAFVSHIRRIKPQASKGTYMKRVCIKATYTPAVTLEVE